MPFATSSPRVMPPKMLMKIDFTLGSVLMTSSAPAITSALAPPPMSRKLAGSPPTWLTTSHVLMASPAPLAMMPTVPSSPMYCRPFSLASRSRSSSSSRPPELVPLGMAERGVVVERHLGVERVHLALGREDERVDLDQIGVALDVAAPQLQQDVDGAVARRGIEVARRRPNAGRRPRSSPSTGSTWRRAMASGASAATCSMSTPPSRRQHAEVQLGPAVEGEAGVVLLGDVGRVLDPARAARRGP